MLADGTGGATAVAGAGFKVRQAVLVFILYLLLWTTSGSAGNKQEEETAKIVGLGAATCRQFNGDVAANPQVRKDYLAWAQGFMSGILSSRPPGIDAGLDLNPPTFGLIAQLRFLEDHCARNVSLDFSDAVAALYKRLRLEGKT